MKQICVFLLCVAAVMGKPRKDESTFNQISDYGVCKDTETCVYCSINRGKCGYDSTIQSQCRRTCGLCPGACQDNSGCSWCNYNKQRGHCNNPDFSKDCRFTCGLCSGK